MPVEVEEKTWVYFENILLFRIIINNFVKSKTTAKSLLKIILKSHH